MLRGSWFSTSYSSCTPWSYFPCTALSLVSDFHCHADRKPHTAALVLHHGELAEFDVLFKPNLAQRMEGKIHLSVVDNPYEKTIIQLVGEGYEDDFTLDNIHGLVADSVEEDAEGSLEEDAIEGERGEAAKVEEGLEQGGMGHTCICAWKGGRCTSPHAEISCSRS